MNQTAKSLLQKIKSHEALIGIIGLGYVGLPLALCFTERGFRVLGFDVDPEKVVKLNRGESYIKHLDANRLRIATGNNAKECDEKFKLKNSKLRTSDAGCDEQLRIKNSKLRIETPLFDATIDFDRLVECDAILICVPTPLGPHKEPDLSYVEDSTKSIRKTLRSGQLIILESTTYPGTTDELLKDILESPSSEVADENAKSKSAMNSDVNATERDVHAMSCDEQLKIKNSKLGTSDAGCDEKLRIKNSELRISDASDASDERDEKLKIKNSKLRIGTDVFLAFSPEREDPGNPNYGTKNIPKVVGGVDEISGDLAEALYAEVLDSTVRVKNARTAEASKLVENIFRGVNIALVNELKMIFEKMDIDIWDVLDAAETKPFGFMRFNPGPGLGGHCLRGDQVVRLRGRGLDGEFALADAYRRLRRDCEAVVTARGMYLETPDLEALSLDGNTSSIRWAPVDCLYRGRFQGQGVQLESAAGVAVTVTSEHPMLARKQECWAVLPADSVTIGDSLPVARLDTNQACTTAVQAIRSIDLSGVVYSLEVAETAAFATNGGVVVHNCIPLDPFYLAWKARESGQPTRFIELAGEINTQMPAYVIEKLTDALNEQGKSVKGSKLLVLGLAYKPDIDDPRESPSFEVIELLLERGAEVSYHDPHIPVAPSMRSWPQLPKMESLPLSEDNLSAIDAAIVVTNHAQVDYDLVLEQVPLVIDTRGVYRNRNGKIKRA